MLSYWKHRSGERIFFSKNLQYFSYIYQNSFRLLLKSEACFFPDLIEKELFTWPETKC